MNSITSKILLITLVFFILGTALALPAAAQGQGQDLSQVQNQEQKQPRFRIGAYFEGYMINDKNLKDFYHHSQINLPGFEASVHTVYNIDVWASFRIYKDEAKTTFYEKLSKFRINAASIGLQYRPVRWKFLEPFVGAGLDLYSYKETVEAGSDISGASGNATGFYVQTGTYVNVFKFIALTGFYRYNGIKKTLANPLPDGSTSLDLGGHEFGGGFVLRF